LVHSLNADRKHLGYLSLDAFLSCRKRVLFLCPHHIVDIYNIVLIVINPWLTLHYFGP
jgi:hypothetical protein